MSTRGDEALDQIRDALGNNDVSIRLPLLFSHPGRAAQVYVKSRKVGPLIVPAEDQSLGDVLKMLGDMTSEANS